MCQMWTDGQTKPSAQTTQRDSISSIGLWILNVDSCMEQATPHATALIQNLGRRSNGLESYNIFARPPTSGIVVVQDQNRP